MKNAIHLALALLLVACGAPANAYQIFQGPPAGKTSETVVITTPTGRVVGAAVGLPTTFIDVNTAYSSVEYNLLGTATGAFAVKMDESYLAASNQSKSNSSMHLTFRYPITLDAAGNPRPLGTITLLVAGIGGASAVRGALKWVEVR